MIDAHRAAFEYDWRTRFSQQRGLSIVGTRRMSWGEAIRLTGILLGDPGSYVAVALAEWEYPVSRDLMALMDIFDSSEMNRAGRKAKPYPRPWKAARKRTYGRGTRLSAEELRAILAAAPESSDGAEVI